MAKGNVLDVICGYTIYCFVWVVPFVVVLLISSLAYSYVRCVIVRPGIG